MSNIGVDIHKDTPTEILHTILLGIVKYYWAQTVWHLEKEKKMSLFQIRLGSVATAGLNIPSIQVEYICHYKGGLIGKHFKTLMQVMSFLVFDLVPRDVLQAWLVIGRLMVIAWCTDIEDIDGYTVREFLSLKALVVTMLAPQTELSTCIQDFLHVTCKCSPSILISKPKFYFLVHLPMYI